MKARGEKDFFTAREMGGMEELVLEEARRRLAGARGSHAFDHSLRVLALSSRIGRAEGADPLVTRLAAILHDIGRPFEDESKGAVDHAEEGARIAAEILAPLALSAQARENVIHSVRCHRFRGGNVPETIEARVLFDADKLDSIGAVGVARAFQFAGEVGARLHVTHAAPEETLPYGEDDTGFREYSVKLRFIRDRMLTLTGRALARERHAFMEAFFARFLAEHEGER